MTPVSRSDGRIVVTGSIATDHLMHFPGKFTDSLLPDQLDRVSLSFLVDDLIVRRGGVAANICFAMGILGSDPVLLDAVGHDFEEYSRWLTDHGVDTSYVHRCDDIATARFVCTTDDDLNQIGSFYAGAMARAREISLADVVRGVGAVDLVLISAGDPDAMAQHAVECRQSGIPFAADPSQQLARITGDQARSLVNGAELLFSNDYEFGLLQSKTGWSAAEITAAVGTRITTLGADGVEIVSTSHGTIRVGALHAEIKADPTGVGDAFRGGFLAGRAAGLSPQRCAELGSLMATLVLETTGTQEYVFNSAVARDRLSDNYGADAAADIAGALHW